MPLSSNLTLVARRPPGGALTQGSPLKPGTQEIRQQPPNKDGNEGALISLQGLEAGALITFTAC